MTMQRIFSSFLLAAALTGIACAAQNWTEAKFSGATLCLDPTLDWKESRIGGILGSHLSYVYVDYPYELPSGEKQILSILIRPEKKKGLPQENQLTKPEGQKLDAKSDLRIFKQADGSEVVTALVKSHIKADPMIFEAVCLDTLHRYCERPFRVGLIEGSYSFARDVLKDWRKWEIGLGKFLEESVVRQCGGAVPDAQ